MKCRKRPPQPQHPPAGAPARHPGRAGQPPVKPVIDRRSGQARERLGDRDDHCAGREHRRFPADRPDEPVAQDRRLPAGHQRQRRGAERRGCGGIHTGGPGNRRHIPSRITPAGSPARAAASPPGRSATSPPRSPSSDWCRPGSPIPPGCSSRSRAPPSPAPATPAAGTGNSATPARARRAWCCDYRGTTVILTGPAQLDEFAVLAAAVVKSLEQLIPAVQQFHPRPPLHRKVGPWPPT